ncbi:MAG: hypothetical protein AB1540_12965 [Bdellovibrionota bacterium]
MKKLVGSFQSLIYSILLLAFTIHSLWAAPPLAGVEGGNTEIFRPRNKKGDLIQTKFTTRHPRHDEIKALIERSALPLALKYEMLHDLAGVNIIESNEIVTYGDTQKELNMVLNKLSKTTMTAANGKAQTTVTEEYAVTSGQNALGISITPYNLVAKDLDRALVAAYTQRSTKTVVYFTEVIKMMEKAADGGAEEVTKLVLHEQAHRLPSLKVFHTDERFIESWVSTLYDFLTGKLTTDSFLAILKKWNISVFGQVEIPGEKYDLGSRTFVLVTDIELRKQDVWYHGLRDFSINRSERRSGDSDFDYVFQVDTKVFGNIPFLEFNSSIDLIYDEVMSAGEYEILNRYIEKRLQSEKPITLKVAFRYKKQIVTDLEGRRHAVLTEILPPKIGRGQQAEIFDEKAAQLMAPAKWAAVLPKNGLLSKLLPFLDESDLAKLLQIPEAFKRALGVVQKSDPDAYPLVVAAVRGLTFSIELDPSLGIAFMGFEKEQKRYRGEPEDVLTSPLIKLPSIESATQVTEAMLREKYMRINPLKTQEYHLASIRDELRGLFGVENMTLSSADLVLARKVRDVLMKYLNGAQRLKAKIACVTRGGVFDGERMYGTEPFSFKLEWSSSQLEWVHSPKSMCVKHSRYNGDCHHYGLNGYELTLRIPRQLLETQPQVLAYFLENQIFSERSFDDSSRNANGRAVWSPGTRELKIDSPQLIDDTEDTTDEAIDLAKDCFAR